MQDDRLLQLIEEEVKVWEAAMPFVQLFDASTATAEQWKTVSLCRMLAPEVLGPIVSMWHTLVQVCSLLPDRATDDEAMWCLGTLKQQGALQSLDQVHCFANWSVHFH